MPNDTDFDETIRKDVETTKTGVTLSLDSTRGTGTRDQDSVSITVRGETLTEVEAQAPDARAELIRHMNALRANQPDEEADD